ncbi:hypothetical protein BJI67_08850 [Acidihalobacter aeolianus]|uniref:phosphomannomutase n=1 Tax=Acidihalobacter aeolianus TaxID=2792603 RepID=A0A1D8K867_9GAMM|nr:hypothetical protein [Acidihalobacter aeolianus]AOV17154.1 hypothetical protein BJI67_08850 [Acidihalobacter aeolianus]
MDNRFTQVITSEGIRYPVERGLHCSDVISLARAYGDMISPEGDKEFVIGYDTRLSSASLSEAVSIGLRSGGHHVTHIGLSSTPMMRWYAAEHGYVGAIMITGGGAPIGYNGFKLYRERAIALGRDSGLDEIAASALPPFYSVLTCTPELRYAAPLPDYAAVIRSYSRTFSPIKIALDVGNGVGGLDTSAVFSHLHNVRIWELNFEPDGSFPNRSPDPRHPQALQNLGQCVVTNGCRFGAAFDGDADDLVVVDENGSALEPERLGALLAQFLLDQHPGGAVVHHPDLRPDILASISAAGGRPIAAKNSSTAAIQITMQNEDALFGMNDQGKYFYGDLYGIDNALRTIIELINGLTENEHPLSSIAANLKSGSV